MTRGAHYDWPTTTYRVVVRRAGGVVERHGPYREPESAAITETRIQNLAKRQGAIVHTEIQVCHHRWDTVKRS